MSPTTDPWMSDTPTLLATADADLLGGMGHLSVCALVAVDGTLIEVPVIDGTLTFDELVSPRVQMSLTTHLSTDPTVLEAVDPRSLARVQLAVGYARPDGVADMAQIADLGLRSVARSRPDDTMTLTARSDEALVIDNTVSATLTISAPTTTQAIEAIIHTCLPSAIVTTDVADTGPAISISQPDGDKWQTLTDLADRLGSVAVYDDGMRGWWIADRPNATATDPDIALSDGQAGTLVSVADALDREADWANRVVMVYKWTDAGGTDHRVVSAADATGRFAPTTGNIRTMAVHREVPTTSADALSTAHTVVNHMVTRGRSYEVSALSCYWVRPGHTLIITEEGKDPEWHLVTKVTFDLSSGLMTLSTRQPE